ncbi:TIGR04325 family methyltransferase [Lysobacter cavernae]|uniref:TIGR04325 family methyltransferase n=1 Tax=Lysobacter cavernae TaxID=1685901 RepID=A0ABV7RJL9_9GAMM
MPLDTTWTLGRKLRRIANESAELPGLRWLAEPLHRRMFRRKRSGNAYCGVYESYTQALASASALRALPTTYDTDASPRMYRDRLEQVRVSDYPLLYWLSRLLATGQRRVFDLGGHIGISYYGFRRYLDYPADLRWQVHDMPSVTNAGRELARELDPSGRLEFTDAREDADDCDLLVTSGVLQYLDYTLPELLQTLDRPPRHVLVNLTPMHPSRGYFTLQNLGIAICPYRVCALPEFVAEMEALGYRLRDRWESFERQLRVPFEPSCTIDSYHGFYFTRS